MSPKQPSMEAGVIDGRKDVGEWLAPANRMEMRSEFEAPRLRAGVASTMKLWASVGVLIHVLALQASAQTVNALDFQKAEKQFRQLCRVATGKGARAEIALRH